MNEVSTCVDLSSNSEAYGRYTDQETNTPPLFRKRAKAVALYSRVSTRDRSQDPESQLLKLRGFAQSRGFQIFDEYVDHASGSSWDRPALKKLMEDGRHKKFDAVAVTKLDRFGRSVIDLEQSVRSLSDWGIDFICVDQPIDTTIPTGKLLFTILAAIAEFERELIRDRVRDGLERARREGKRIGRPRILTPEIEEAIKREYAKSGSLKETSKVLRLSKSTVWRGLHKQEG